MRWLLLLLIIPFAAGSINIEQHVTQTISNGAGPAILAVGDIGTPTIGASAHAASVALAGLPLVADDILTLDSVDAGWQVHAELVSQSDWGLLESVTVSLADGVLVAPQISITLGVLDQTSGSPVDLPEITTDTEVRVVGIGTGTVTFDLVLTPDVGGAELRYRVDLTVS